MEPLRRSKAAFWALLLAFACLAGVPSVMLMRSIERYVRFLWGWDPGSLKATGTRYVPHRRARREEPEPAVHFVEFRLRAPRAKRVLLAGDFNQWQPETLPLRKGKDGVWETLLPLPPGRYSYLFSVDGAWVVDPRAPQSGRHAERPASLREVP